MKLGLLAIPAAFLLFIAAVLVGCGSSTDTLTLEEYFERFEAMDADVDAQFEEAYADFPEGDDFFADEANLPFFRDLTAAFLRITGDSLDRVTDLDPTSEVEDAHDDMVGALENLLVTFEEGFELIDEAETMAEVSALNDEIEPSIDAAMTRFEAACLDVVAIAVANGIHTNISCEDDG